MKSENEFKTSFGKTLSETRKKNGITQQQLAEAINYSDKSVSKWERGESLPDLYTTYSICEKLGINPNYLYGIEAESESINPEYLKEKQIKEKMQKLISVFVPAISAVGILFICCILYFVLKNIPHRADIAPVSFSLIIPVMFTVLLILSFILWKYHVQFVLLSGLIWSLGWSLNMMLHNLFSTSIASYILVSCILLQIIAVLVYIFVIMLKKIKNQ